MAVALNKIRKPRQAMELPIAPMIDVVFLLLVYFMVSSSIQKQEADIAFRLPVVIPSAEKLDLPEEQLIEIDAAGRAWVNGFAYDDPELSRYERLAAMLNRYREGAEAAQLKAKISIAPSDDTPHQMVVKVMDACSAAGLSEVSFALE